FLVISSFKDKQSAPDRLQAKAFEVVDDYGNVLVKVTSYKEAGAVTTYTKAGKTLVDILKNVDGNGAVVGFNSLNAIAYRLTGTDKGGGVLDIYNSNGKEVVYAGPTTSNGGLITIYNASGNQVVTTGQTAEQNGVINIYNRNNNRINAMGGDADNNGVFNGWSNSGTKTVQLPN
ncbi:MAG TPA: hypothetical protein VMY77_01240, partial [Chitinophagaceae bacterium]|nr:hypothetical protein [Chitinophagaceae bacterium]